MRTLVRAPMFAGDRRGDFGDAQDGSDHGGRAGAAGTCRRFAAARCLPNASRPTGKPLVPDDFTRCRAAVWCSWTVCAIRLLRAAWLGAATARIPTMIALVTAILLAFATAASAQTTFRDANGRLAGTVTTDSNGQKTFRDGAGRITGTATTDA